MEEIPVEALIKKRNKSRTYCCHGLCTSNTIDKEHGVTLLPFPKPCNEYIATIIDSSLVHNTKKCPLCSKCLRWIHLCKRSDSRLKELCDISKHTKICTKHFVGVFGPTETDPDPVPADSVKDRIRKPSRRAPKDRLPVPHPEKRRSTTSFNGAEKIKDSTAINLDLKIEPGNESPGNQDLVSNYEKSEELPTGMDEDVKPNVTKTTTDVATLRSLAHEFLDKNLNVEFDGEFLAISSIKNRLLLEKSCVINSNLEIKIFVLGKLITDDNKFWKEYPKKWSQELDSYSFFKDLFENWYVCQSCTEKQLIGKAKESASKTDSYEYDSVTDSVRSVNCALLTAEEICFHCRQMITRLRTKYRKRPPVTCRKISKLSREDAQATLRQSRIEFSNMKKKNYRLCLKLQKLMEREKL